MRSEKTEKMTNKEDGDTACDNAPRVAALLAVHLVSQILDEAYVIASAAKESGQPWRNLSILKSFKPSKTGETDDDESFEASKGDSDLNENKAEIVANVVATSTPQKVYERGSSSGENDLSQSIVHNDNPFIGQGDEDIETQNELTKSTSLFINHLFDMSDVERIVICDDPDIIPNTEPNNLITDAMNQIMASYVASNFVPLETFPLVPSVDVIERMAEQLSRSDNSEYFVTDTYIADISRDVAFYIDDNTNEKQNVEFQQPAVVQEIEEEDLNAKVIESNESVTQDSDVALYEDAYASLNRDYDQGSEDGFPILQDPKGMALQEIELMTNNTSDNEPDSECRQVQNVKETVPTDSGVSGSRKSTLARRCRIQGARLFACLRGWWRRKTPGTRKESRNAGTVLGMCPLSPDARRRASSLMDNRLLRSPSPSRPVIWKFNTVNEVLVNSNRWKEYTFDTQTDGSGEATEC